MPGDTRLITFPYEANDTYTILTRPHVVTHIELAADETVVTFAIGDASKWQAEHAANNIFIKPTYENSYTNAVLVTSKKRVYQLVLRSAPDGGKWYQRVSWTYPGVILYQEATDEKRQRDEKEENSAPIRGLDPSKLNFAYTVKGDAPFKPVTVFDDGRFTWIQLPPGIQDLPGLFLRADDKTLELANYLQRENFLVLQRLAKGIVLKLGKAEVDISAGAQQLQKQSRSWFSKD
jgi:type IV secretion system protein VirB9